MKAILTILILMFNATLFAQSETIVGNYAHTSHANDNDILEYKITLSQDGTFFFHYYSRIKHKIPPEVDKYGKGKWTADNNVVTFYSDKEKDFDAKHTLDFSNSKARFIIKSPRDKTDKIVQTKLQFLKSDIFWMERIGMLKI